MTEPDHGRKKIDGSMEESARMRGLAEERARVFEARESETFSPEEVRPALDKLRVRQVELEMQNEELLRRQADLDASRARYCDLYNLAPVGYFTISPKDLVVEANLTAATLLGTDRIALLKRPFYSFIHKKDYASYFFYRKLLFETGQRQIFELRMIKAGGEMFWARLEATVTLNEDDASVCRLVMSDITAHKRAELVRQTEEARVEHVNDLLLAIREVGTVLNREKDPLKLLGAVCNSLVQTRGYVMVWIGRPEAGSKRVVPVAHSGVGAELLKQCLITWDENPSGQGPSGTAIRERRPAVFDDAANDPRFALWKEPVTALGVVSIASVPLIHRERLFGVLTLEADRPHAFDAEELLLLSGLADDMARRLQSLEDELARRQAEKEVGVQKEILEKIFENAPYIMMLVDKEGRVLKVNRTCLDFCGRPEHEIPGLFPGQVFNCINSLDGLEWTKNPQCSNCPVLTMVMHTFETEQSVYNAEGRLTVRKGSADVAVDVLISTTMVKDGDSNAVLVTMIDITEHKRTAEALRENEERLRLLFEHAPVQLAMFDREMRYLSVSRKWIDDYNLPYRDLRGLSHYEVFPEIREERKMVHRRALAGEVLKAEEDRFERADGSVQWLRWEVRPWRNAAGAIGGIVIFTKDITELRKAREFLRIERDLALKLGSTGDLVEAMQSLLEACLEFEKLDSGGVYLVERQTGALKLICYRGVTDGFAKKLSFFEPGSPQTQFAMHGEPGYLSKPFCTLGLDDLIAREGLTAFAAIPVKYNGEVVALLNLGSHVLPEIPRSIRFALEHISGHIGGVVARVRLADTIKAQSADLKEANVALKLLLKQRELDRDELEESLLTNVKNLVLPYLEKLKKSPLDSDQRNLLGILHTHLLEIASPFAKRISAPLLGLTPMEIRVADLIRQGLGTKEISELLRISDYAVIFHRQNIRNKLGLTGKKLNLQTYLNTLL